MKRKPVVALVACLILLAAYVYGANAYLYYRIHIGNLAYPDTTHSYAIRGAGAPRVYAALGDSLTAGVGVQTYQESYPYQVAAKLAHDDAINLRVFAYPGETSTGLIDHYLTSAVASSPDIATVMIGTNDIHNWVSSTEFEANYREIVEALQKTRATIYLISIPYIGSSSMTLPPLNYYFDYKTRQFNTIIKALADEYNVTYIDIASPTKELFKKDGNVYATDSFHPSALGYKRWSDIIYAGIHQ